MKITGGFEPEIDPFLAHDAQIRMGTPEVPDAPRWERRAKPGALDVEVRLPPSWCSTGHVAPVRLSRYQTYVLARVEDMSLSQLIGHQPVPVLRRTTPRARSARRRSRTRRSRSRDPDDPPHRRLSAARLGLWGRPLRRAP